MEFHRFVFNSVDIDDNHLLNADELSLFFDLVGTPMTSEELTISIQKMTDRTAESVSFEQLYETIIEPLSKFD